MVHPRNRNHFFTFFLAFILAYFSRLFQKELRTARICRPKLFTTSKRCTCPDKLLCGPFFFKMLRGCEKKNRTLEIPGLLRVSETRSRVSIPRLAMPKNGHFRKKNYVGPQTETRAVRVVWGAKVHPKLTRKIIGEASFPVLGVGKNITLEPKNQVFKPLRARFGSQDMDQKLQMSL